MNPVDLHGAGPQVKRRVCRFPLVCWLTGHFDRADGWRNLLYLALESPERLYDMRSVRSFAPHDRPHRTIGIKALAGDIEVGAGAVELGLVHDSLDELGGATQTKQQDSRSRWIERSCVPALSLSGHGANAVERFGGGDPGWLVEIDDSVH
jgi:hypothetical protein